MHSIRFRLSAITLSAILISIAAVVLMVLLTVGRENDRNATEKLTLLCENQRQSLDDYFDSIEQSVEMAANIAVDSLDGVTLVEGGVAGEYARTHGQTPEQAAELDAYLAAYCARVQAAFGSVANHTNGVVTYYYCLTPEMSKTVHGFFYSMVDRTGFEEQPPLDARRLDPKDFEHTTWYYTTIERGRPSWIGPYSAHFLDEMMTVSYITPIYKAGALVGVLGMDIPFDTMVSQISALKVYDTGFYALYDASGTILYHPELPMGSTPGAMGERQEESIFRQENSGGKEIRYTYNGVERQMAFSTLSSGMKLIVTAPVSEITASWTHLIKLILIATAAVIAIFTVVLVLALRVLVTPLQRLTAASGRLAAGEYDVELDYDGEDEIGVLTGSFRQMRDHLKQYIGDLNRRINTDELTGLPSVSRFYERADSTAARILEEGARPALLFFNLNGMKDFNRQYGLEEGDRLLCAAADIIARHFGKENCCRMGQDHFVAVTRSENLDARLKAVFKDFTSANSGRTLPVRVGVYEDRLKLVDASTACDHAKYTCDMLRGSFVSDYRRFDDSMLTGIESYRYVVNNLDRALEERWIKVFFQPIVRAASGRVCDEEALSRWVDPDRGLISPGDFIPILENARLIYRLDLYVLDQILLKLQEQQAEGLYLVPQSLNISRIDFESCDIVDEICRRIDAAGIPRDKLTVELTESAVGQDFEFMKAQVQRLQELGFKVWMDDFGSGYSSLDVLQDIHFDLIKLDMRFMHRFDEGPENRIIVTELVKMALALGVETVCEGVETREQAEFLREVGCTKLQGYYFCRPIPMEQILERYRKGVAIGFENPDEAEYFAAIGRINLYDLTAVSNDSSEKIANFFDTLPMAVVECDAEVFRTTRANNAYRSFALRNFHIADLTAPRRFDSLSGGPDSPFADAVQRCREEGMRLFFDGTLPNGSVVHSMARHVAQNPVTGITAVAVAILGISEPSGKASDTDIK